jgi:hypothetical protein
MKRLLPLALTLLTLAACQQPTKPVAALPPLDTATIDRLTSLKGTMNEKEHVYKITYPRTDLHVSVADPTGNVILTPPMALTSWAAFQRCDDCVMVMGDTVLTADQINPVMSVALDNGLQVTALHNHFLDETPRIMFMHISGEGTEEQLASAVAKMWAKIKETAGAISLPFNEPPIDPANSTLDPAKIDSILGVKGDYTKGVYKMTIGLTTKMDDHTLGNAMGVNTWAVFVGSDDRSAVMGDFAMLDTDLQSVLKSLRKANISIVSIHNHMTEENPRIMFLHYWAIGKTTDLATALKSALDVQHH